MDGNGVPMWVVFLAIIVVIAGAGWIVLNVRRSRRLRRQFGPEYARAIEQEGGSRQAEKVLAMRERRVEELRVRDLTDSERRRFREAWRADQARFVENPDAAVTEADKLVTGVMALRGYPIADFEQRAADISVRHPLVVESYRKAHELTLRHQRGAATTEDLRKAMVHYRVLFDELVGWEESQRLAARA